MTFEIDRDCVRNAWQTCKTSVFGIKPKSFGFISWIHLRSDSEGGFSETSEFVNPEMREPKPEAER